MKSIRFLAMLAFAALIGMQLQAMEEVDGPVPMELEKTLEERGYTNEVLDAFDKKDNMERRLAQVNPALTSYLRVLFLYNIEQDKDAKDELGQDLGKMYTKHKLREHQELIGRWFPEYFPAAWTIYISEIGEDKILEEFRY